jgi:hypothetical protein
MIGFDGRLQWRQHKAVKLHAKLLRRKDRLDGRRLAFRPPIDRSAARILNLRFAQMLCGAQELCRR